MKPAFSQFRTAVSRIAVFSIILTGGVAAAEPLTLKHAVQLALLHSPAAGQAAADEQRASASYRETRDQFIPQILIGAGLGDSWGYPLGLEGSAPSLVNISAQSALFNVALRNGIRAARSEYRATQLSAKDRHNQIVQDTTLAYLELVKWQQLLGDLQKQHDDSVKMEQVVEERVEQGIDSPQQRTEARLSTARAKLRLAQAQGAIDELQATLSQLTGMRVGSIELVPDSVPALPELPSQMETPAKAVETSPAVQFAQEHAQALSFRARAEHQALLPSVDFATQYAALAKFNNWVKFFPVGAFQRNNASVGVVIRFPFFNASQHAHAEAADAEAVRARREAEATMNQVSQETLRLQRSIEQLGAAQEVSALEYELAKSDLDSIQIRLTSGNATVHDADNARIQMAAKYDALQDASFQLLRARVGLMRATGELESWVEQTK